MSAADRHRSVLTKISNVSHDPNQLTTKRHCQQQPRDDADN